MVRAKCSPRLAAGITRGRPKKTSIKQTSTRIKKHLPNKLEEKKKMNKLRIKNIQRLQVEAKKKNSHQHGESNVQPLLGVTRIVERSKKRGTKKHRMRKNIKLVRKKSNVN